MKWLQIRKRNEDLERELRSDLELEEEEQRDRGLPPDEARHAARRAFGNTNLIREQTHESWGSAPFERFLQDLRFGLRQLRRNPGFTFTATIMLALGIGASVAMFAFVDAALFKPLPYLDPAHLVAVFESDRLFDRAPLSYLDYLDWKRMSRSFTSIDI